MPRQASPATSVAASSWEMSCAGVQPEPRADLGHAHQGHREQPGLLAGQPGVLVDHLGDRLGALAGDPVDPLAHGRLVGQVGLEDQPERALGAGDVVVEDVHRRRDALLVVVGRRRARPCEASMIVSQDWSSSAR